MTELETGALVLSYNFFFLILLCVCVFAYMHVLLPCTCLVSVEARGGHPIPWS